MGPDKYIKNYIEGALAPAENGAYLDDLNPATGKAFSQVPDSELQDVERAVEAAEKVFPTWSSTEPQRRFRLLMRIADIIEQNLEAFARAESQDTGKPLALSRSADVPKAQSYFRYYATAILHRGGQSFSQPGQATHYLMHRPLGVVGSMVPWNRPLQQLAMQVAAALAAGNCVVAKPPVLAPMTAHLLAKACVESGLPPGVLNIVHGTDEVVGAAIAGHPKIKAIAYSGTSADGASLASEVAASLKKTLLQLGGKNPAIIFADCAFDQMIIGILRSCFSNSGQLNHCTSRLYVERPLYENFRDELVKRTQFLKVGDPFSSVTDLGPLISLPHRERVESYLALVEVEGGEVLCGGNAPEMTGDLAEGFFLRPAVVEGLEPESRLNQEEILGPVVTLAPFDTEEEALALANSTPFGLGACVWTRDLYKANRLAEGIQAGTIWLNGWMLQDLRSFDEPLGISGQGQSGGMELFHFFTQSKNIFSRY